MGIDDASWARQVSRSLQSLQCEREGYWCFHRGWRARCDEQKMMTSKNFLVLTSIHLMSLEATSRGSTTDAGAFLPRNSNTGQQQRINEQTVAGGGAKLKLVRLNPHHNTTHVATKLSSAFVSPVGSALQKEQSSQCYWRQDSPLNERNVSW